MSEQNPSTPQWHGTTILSVRKGDKVVVAGDGQVSLGDTVVKGSAKKVRRLAGGDVIAGFAGATADAFTLFERLEAKLEQYPGQLTRAAVELAKDWRTDRYLRRLEAMMAVADKEVSLVLTGNGPMKNMQNYRITYKQKESLRYQQAQQYLEDNPEAGSAEIRKFWRESRDRVNTEISRMRGGIRQYVSRQLGRPMQETRNACRGCSKR